MFLIAAACVAVVVVALFNGGASGWKDVEDLSLTSLFWPDTGTAPISALAMNYACPQCGLGVDWGSELCPRCGWRWVRLMNQAALPCAPAGRLAAGGEANAERIAPAAAKAPPATLLSPREQNAAGKEFIEGHWLGLEVIPLAPELAAEYQVPDGETGVLVDEITLEAAESGILAGDMVQSVEGCPTSDLRAFFLATQHVQENERARLGISRRGSRMTFVMEARNSTTLGFAQMEAAQPIQPGAISPHRSRGRPCTHCHIIMKTGGQLPTDAGDILPSAPPIASGAQAPHQYRGRCPACHVVK